jgi:YVTN family beta-propeller protein
MEMNRKWLIAAAFLPITLALMAQESGPPATPTKKARRPPPPGVTTPGVKREITSITPTAVFDAGSGAPDWQVVTDDSVWVSNGPLNSVHRLDAKTNKIAATIAVGKKPCSGLAAGFGSIWVPSCGDKTLGRIDIVTNTLTNTLPIPPAESEGGIAVSEDAVWLVTDPAGKLARIDPKTNAVAMLIDVPAGSASVVYGDGAVWVTTPSANVLTRVDAKTNQVTDSIAIGKGPRFETFGADAVWTLNQGDGTISRVDTKTRKLTAAIEAGLVGTGGEIAFGLGHVWATLFQIPITEIDPASNMVVRQWTGDGGDSIRAAHGSVWLSNLRAHNVWRIDPEQLR